MDYSIDLDTGLERLDQASANALERLRKDGLSPDMDRPRNSKNNSYFDGRLPSNLNNLSAHELGDLLNMMTQYADFVSTKETVAKALVLNTEQKLELIKAKLIKTKTGSAAEKTAEVNCDSRYVEHSALWLEAKEYSELLQGLGEAARRNLRTISRAIETLKMTNESGHRNENVNNRPRFRNDTERQQPARPVPRPSRRGE